MRKSQQQLLLPSLGELRQPSSSKPLVTPSFARHETFHPRHGWLKKGFDAAEQDPYIFLDENAPTRLGVGKNMARAIRYWCYAFKVLSEEPSSRGKREGARPTTFGNALLSSDGWDPFLEDPASLWLLHWQLMKSPSVAASWYFAFNVFSRREFSTDELTTELAKYCFSQFSNARIADSSLRKDVHCMIRMYLPNKEHESVSEDTLGCPFAEMGLLRETADSRVFEFEVGLKPTLPPEILVATCLEFVAISHTVGRTVPLAQLLRAPGAPGMVFKLSEAALYGAIEDVARYCPVAVSDSAGIIQFAFEGDPMSTSDSLLKKYYSVRGAGV